MSGGRPRLLLLGAGHAHLEVLRRLALTREAALATTLVSLGERHVYSGMIPGFLAGQYVWPEVSWDVPALARAARAECVIGCAATIDPVRRLVGLADGRTLRYDLLSVNIGSALAGAADQAAERVKPFARVRQIEARLERLAQSPGPAPVRAVVVGGGAGGVELAFALAARLDRAGRAREVTLVERGPRLLQGYGVRFCRLADAALARRNIAIVRSAGDAEAEEGSVLTADGMRLPSELSVWVTGPVGAPVLASSGLPLCERGFLRTRDTLQSVGDPAVFAAGDCGTLASHPELPKSGVYAVRQGPVLWRNLRAAARGTSLARFAPQAHFLSILNTCDDRGLLRYRGLAYDARWAWRLKDRIDRRFIRRYDRMVRASVSLA